MSRSAWTPVTASNEGWQWSCPRFECGGLRLPSSMTQPRPHAHMQKEWEQVEGTEDCGKAWSEVSSKVGKKPRLTADVHLEHLLGFQGRLNDVKSVPAGRVVIFSDEKTWDCHPPSNRWNDQYCSRRTLMNQCALSRRWSSRHQPCLLAFRDQLGTRTPGLVSGWVPAQCGQLHLLLEDKSYSEMFPTGKIAFQQDGGPGHTARKTQMLLRENITFWPEETWPQFNPVANPFEYACETCGLQGSPPQRWGDEGCCQWELKKEVSQQTTWIKKKCAAFMRCTIAADGSCIK